MAAGGLVAVPVVLVASAPAARHEGWIAIVELRRVVAAALDAGDAVRAPLEGGVNEIPMRIAQEEGGSNRVLLFADAAGRAIVANLFASPSRICASIGAADYAGLFSRLEGAIERPLPLGDRVPLAQNRLHQRAPDLLEALPALRHSAEDAGAYLTSGILVARSEDRGRHHYCFVRMAMVGGNRLVVNPATRRMREIVEARLRAGRPLEVAILIGAPAEVVVTACVSVPSDCDKFEVAQALAGGSLAFAGNGVPVPGATEIILTGSIIPRYETEGPVGDQKGLYSLKPSNPVCVVDDLWARERPLFHAIAGGVSREHIELVTLGPRAVLERILRTTPEVLRYELPRFAGGRLAVLVVTPRFDPAAVTERLWAISSVRGCIAVNEDVDPSSGADVLWALLERANLPSDFLFSAQGHPVSGARKFLIDAATRSPGDWNQRRIRVYHSEN